MIEAFCHCQREFRTIGLPFKSFNRDVRPVDADYHTAAGLALDRLARIPDEGDTFDLDGWRVEVLDMDSKRVDKLLFTPPEAVRSERAAEQQHS